MKKKIIFGLLLAVMLSLSMSSTVAAASNVVINEKGQETTVYEWILDGASGYYEVTETLHLNWHYMEYADGTAKYNYHLADNAEGYGDGIYGDYYEYTYQYRNSFNTDVGNGLVETEKDITVLTTGNGAFDFMNQIIFHFANGEVRVDIERFE